MFCSRCGTKNPEDSANCYNCGQKMATPSDLSQLGNTKPAEAAALHAELATHHQAQKQFDTEQVHGHEYGLICTAAIEGVASGNFVSHLHPDVKDKLLYGGVNFKEDPYVLQEGRDQKYTRAQVWENTKKWLRIYMGGAAADELLHGITFENSYALVDDVAKSENLLCQHHIDGEDAKIMIQRAFNKAKQNFIDHPVVLDVIRVNSPVREEGLSRALNASEKRLTGIQGHVKELINEQ